MMEETKLIPPEILAFARKKKGVGVLCAYVRLFQKYFENAEIHWTHMSDWEGGMITSLSVRWPFGVKSWNAVEKAIIGDFVDSGTKLFGDWGIGIRPIHPVEQAG